MNYAAYVEAKGFDVITSSEVLASRIVPQMLRNLGINNIERSGDEVLNDLFPIVRDSGLMEIVDGELYKDGPMRPLDSDKEDVVMAFKTGEDGQFQEGYVVINIYVPDIDNGSGGNTKNSARTTAISQACYEIFENKSFGEYLFWYGNMVNTFSEDEIGQHFVNIDLRFKHVIY